MATLQVVGAVLTAGYPLTEFTAMFAKSTYVGSDLESIGPVDDQQWSRWTPKKFPFGNFV
jgi:hypothetical protein